MTERDKILARVREALTVPAPAPGAHAGGEPPHSAGAAHAVSGAGASRWLPAVGASFQEQLDLFRSNAAELRAEFFLLENVDALREKLRDLSSEAGWQRIATHAGALTDDVCGALALPILRTDRAYDVNELEKCDAGISECEAFVAQTGSVLVTSRSAGGRALSVLPPHHVVLARRGQLVPDLPAAFALLRERYGSDGGGYPSFTSLITGPSRTGDIERVLVLGAHGPKRLTILCV